MSMHDNVEYVMLTAEQIDTRVKELAAQLDKLYEGRRPVVVCVLKGSVLFFTDLIRNMKTSVELDFMSVSSYGSGTKSTGELKINENVSLKDVEWVQKAQNSQGLTTISSSHVQNVLYGRY